MDLIAYWNVVKRQQRIVVIGLCIAGALVLVSLIKPTATGLAWRTPPVYDAETTLLVTLPGFPEGRVGDPTADTSPQLAAKASLYARRAESDVIERAVSRKLKIEEPEYDAAPLPGVEGRELPLVQIRGYETTPEGAVALANGVSNALRSFITREQETNRISGKDRVELQVWEEAEEAEVFQGVRLTRPIMLFLLVSLVTLGAAFVVDNFRGGRGSGQAQAEAHFGGEPKAGLGVVPDDDDPRTSDAEDIREVAGRIQPANQQIEEEIAESSPAPGRWAAPS